MQVTGAKAQTNAVPGNDAAYEHSQDTVSDTWIVNHPLHKHASVTVVDSSNRVVIGSISYQTLDQLTIEFAAPFSGKAFLN
jgi:hypothetical protein